MKDPCCRCCYKLGWQRPSWNFIQDRHKSSTRTLSSSTFPLSLLCSSQLFTDPWLPQQQLAGCSNTRFTMPGLAQLEHNVLKHAEQDARGANTPHGTHQVFLFYRDTCFWYKKKPPHHRQQKNTSASLARTLRSCGAFLQEQRNILVPAALLQHQDRVVPANDDRRDPWGRQHCPALSLVAPQGSSRPGTAARGLLPAG